MNDELTMNSSGEFLHTEGLLKNEDFNLNETLPLLDLLPELDFDSAGFDATELLPKLAPRGPPARTSFPGKYEFAVEINSSHTNKKKYVFSHKLNRIYVDIDMDFSVQFNWRGPPSMYVRSTCVFADEAQAEKRVQRCLQHFHQSTNTDASIALNVLHSSRGAASGVQYCGRAAEADSWLSVRVALARRGAEPASHAYRFVCKNSCASGINRRAILIVFTLEDQHGNVLGRQVVGARVCACPRRDLVKDEGSEGAPRNKRRAAAPPAAPLAAPLAAPPAAKVKREDGGDFLLNLSMLSPDSALLGLQVMTKMEEQINKERRSDHRSDVINHLKQLQEDIKSKHPSQ